MKRLLICLISVLGSISARAECVNISGQFVATDGSRVLLEQNQCISVNVEFFRPDRYRVSKLPGSMDGKCNEICYYPQPGCKARPGETRCMPICAMYYCRTFRPISSGIRIEENFAFEPVDKVIDVRIDGESKLSVEIWERGSDKTFKEYFRIP